MLFKKSSIFGNHWISYCGYNWLFLMIGSQTSCSQNLLAPCTSSPTKCVHFLSLPGDSHKLGFGSHLQRKCPEVRRVLVQYSKDTFSSCCLCLLVFTDYFSRLDSAPSWLRFWGLLPSFLSLWGSLGSC